MPSRIESIEKAAREATQFAVKVGFGEEELFAIDMAVREAAANAIKHGNLEDATKPVNLTFNSTDVGFEILIRDFGSGFAVEEISDPTEPENLLKASGRGILFMRSFMDEVEWLNHKEGGMIVKMLKRR